ncbi:hydroxyacid dehydrogenase [Chloroflexi bacterium TSY]|nr:hydroxyacid dehydrogenase [Chloroflexi bacterium TSY]
MTSLIVVHPNFERHWPFVADHFRARWAAQEQTDFIRMEQEDDRSLGQVATEPARFTRLASLGVPVTQSCLQKFTDLSEATLRLPYGGIELEQSCFDLLSERGVTLYSHPREGYWSQSVSEFALGLTICGLRRIPQNYHEMLTSHEAWMRYSARRNQGPNQLGTQFSDDVNFVNGTIRGKQVRIVGAGNIGSHYASFVNMLGADVAAWDPFAPEAAFHRAGSHRVWHLDELMRDAEIFVPMLPLTEQTRRLVTEKHIRSLPNKTLVVLATRANICHMPTIRERVLANELALAADVFDVEPVPLDDPLLGRHNVVHTPHLAGRTRDANFQWADDLINQFRAI